MGQTISVSCAMVESILRMNLVRSEQFEIIE